MTLLGSPPRTPGRPVVPRRPLQPENAEAKAARLRLRKRLILFSLPVVVVLLLASVKLLSMVAFGQQARTAYAAGNLTSTQEAAARLGLLNLVERHKAPFASGDAKVLAGDWDGARAAFEEALTLAPADGPDACQIRVNLALSLEKLSEAATQRGDTAGAKAADDRVLAVVSGASAGCFDGGGQDGSGDQLRDAQQRAQQREQAQSDQQQQQQQNQPSPQQQQPSQEKQDQLDQKTQDNLQQRQQGDQQSGSSSRPPVDKPW